MRAKITSVLHTSGAALPSMHFTYFSISSSTPCHLTVSWCAALRAVVEKMGEFLGAARTGGAVLKEERGDFGHLRRQR